MRIVLALLLLVALAFAGLNTPAGFRLLEALAAEAGVGLAGLDGRFPDRLTAARLTISDEKGAWLEASDLLLDWSPSAMLRGAWVADTLTARTVTIARFPQGGGSSGGGLPDIAVAHVDVATLTVLTDAAAVRGAVTLGADVDVRLAAEMADARGSGKVTLTAELRGPVTAARLAARLTGAGTAVALDGALDLDHASARLHLVSDPVSLAGGAVQRIELDLEGTPAAATAHAILTGLRLPGARPDLLGTAPVTLDVAFGPDLSLDLHATTASLHVQGPVPGADFTADWRLTLPDLAAFAPGIAGSASLRGSVAGTPETFTVLSNIDAKVAGATLAGAVTLRGLPAAPVASADLTGSWNGQPATLAAGAARDTEGVFHVTVAKADFAGVQAQAAFAFDPALGWPEGRATLSSAKLPAPAAAGRVQASIDLAAGGAASITAEGQGLALPGAALGRATLSAQLSGLSRPGAPVIKAMLTGADLRAGGVTQAFRLDADGDAKALALRLGATGTAALQAAGTLNLTARQFALASAQATAQGQTLRLSAPARIDFANGVTVDRLRLALGAASLDVAGRLAPALDLTAALRAAPASLARLIDPALDAEGLLQAEASLRGPPDRPSGIVRVNATGLRLKSAGFVPPAAIVGTATLNGTLARIDARVTAGPTALTVTGTAPQAPGQAFDLRAAGTASLALLDPFLAPDGRQARGIVALDATLTGVEPRPGGTLTLRSGSFRDVGQGLSLTDIAATLHADPGRLVLDSLTARGPGPITASGSLQLDGARALSAKLSARDITPLASDALTAKLSAELTASGALDTGLTAAGRVRVARADIRIPEKLPVDLPTLTLRQPGAPPPAGPGIGVALDITLAAPSDIHLRGRGIDAELAGELHLGGTIAAPKPTGGFTLTRGQVSLAGQTLNFSTGKVGFDGHLPIDPTLDFVAKSQGSSVIATLTIDGTASHPRISLSSVPELPQDEVLAQLLFRRSASSLSPFQIAQIATGLAQLTDVGGASRFDPLGRVRQELGLDVLTVGGGPGGRQNVEAGINLRRGVYVGARQATGGVGTQAVVRVDLARGLRLEAELGQPPPAPTTTTAGAPPSGNQVSLTYEFEY